MFHVELRQFPHNSCRFNLTEQELRAAVIDPWAREKWITFGERKWNPNEAKLTVLEGPQLPVDQLSMGRGWRNAERHGENVTERILAAARQAMQAAQASLPVPPAGSEGPAATASSAPAHLLADSLGLELLADLGSEPAPLRRAWELAQARHPGRVASESLAMAELAVRSLLQAGLIVLSVEAEPVQESESTLRAAESWLDRPGAGRVLVRRS